MTAHPSFRRAVTVLIAAAGGLAVAPPGARAASTLLTVTTAVGTQPALDLANYLTGCGVTVRDARFQRGSAAAFGRFVGDPGVVGFSGGVVISSGAATGVMGPNNAKSTTGVNGGGGDPRLDALSGQTSYDAAILEFQFVTSSTVLTFDYVFGSEEYNEYVNSSFNDVFAFWLDGVNLAVLPGTATPVTINSVNNGNPIGSGTITNPQYYLDNDQGTATVMGGSTTRFAGTQLDGLTVVFTVTVTLTPGVLHTLEFAVADAADTNFDSAVFVRAGSLTSGGCPPPAAPVSPPGPVPPLSIAPNPWRPGRGGAQDAATLTLRQITAGATVRVYTTGGGLVRELADIDRDGVVTWDGTNASGSATASGVYLVVVEAPDGGRTVRRLVVAR